MLGKHARCDDLDCHPITLQVLSQIDFSGKTRAADRGLLITHQMIDIEPAAAV
jgi:hypothetical protein